MAIEVGTDYIINKYSISRHSLNILIEHSPEFIGYLRQDRVWNGQAYINKNIFNADIEHTKEEVEQQILNVKAKIKADKKANATDEEIINARKRTLDRHNRKQLKDILDRRYDEQSLYWIKKYIREKISELENIEYIKDKANETAKILKSKESVIIEVTVYADEYDVRVSDIPIYYLDVGDEIEWEKIWEADISHTELQIYKYELNGEIIGFDYKILGYKIEQKYEVLETYITHKY